jgi:phosphoribosylanthranilate isomerase
MSLKTKVKAGNITNLHEARYCAGMGVDWLGFRADTVDATTFKDITNWVSGPQFVLELSEATSLESIATYQISLLEISYKQLGLIDIMPEKEWIVKLPISVWDEEKSELMKYKDHISCLIVDVNTLGTILLANISTHFKILINQSDNFSLDELLALPMDGINIAAENGVDNSEQLASVLNALERED